MRHILVALLALTAAAARAQTLPTVSGTAVEAAEPVIVGASTGHYFRLIGSGNVHVGVAALYDTHGVAPVSYLTEIALVTHSKKDGSIIPRRLQELGIAAEDWDPLHIGAGGSAHVSGGRLTGNAVVGVGTSFNACPLVLSWAVRGIGPAAPLPLQVLRAAIVGDGSVYPKVRLGYALQGQAIKDGVFQSAKEAFPGQGFLDVVDQAGRIEVALGWSF